MGLDRTYNAHQFIFSFSFAFLFVPCGGLSWLPVSFLLHVKYTLSYRIVHSYYEINNQRPMILHYSTVVCAMLCQHADAEVVCENLMSDICMTRVHKPGDEYHCSTQSSQSVSMLLMLLLLQFTSSSSDRCKQIPMHGYQSKFTKQPLNFAKNRDQSRQDPCSSLH